MDEQAFLRWQLANQPAIRREYEQLRALGMGERAARDEAVLRVLLEEMGAGEVS